MNDLSLKSLLDGTRKDEREECAKLAEKLGEEFDDPALGWRIAQAIRERS